MRVLLVAVGNLSKGTTQCHQQTMVARIKTRNNAFLLVDPRASKRIRIPCARPRTSLTIFNCV